MDAGRGVGVLHADLRLEPVGIPKEEAEHGPEIRHVVVGGPSGDQPLADLLERVERRRLEGQVIEAGAAASALRVQPVRLSQRS